MTALAFMLALPSVAAAHATLLSSSPGAGERLAHSPSVVRLSFSEPLEPSLGRIVLVWTDGHEMPLSVAVDPRDVRALVAPLDSLGPGAYRLSWRVVSADGHPVSGSFVFYVGAAATTATAVHAPPPVPLPPADTITGTATQGIQVAGAPVLPSVLRSIAVGCIMACTGLLFFISWMRAPLSSRPARVCIWLALASPLLLGAHFLAWIANASPDRGIDAASVRLMLGTGVGHVELWRIGLALVALWAIALVRRPRLALAFAFGTLVESGTVGHSAAIQPIAAIPSKALHILAASAWMGGLLWLMLAERGSDADVHNVERFRRDAGRVSGVALTAVIVVALTGIIQSVLFLPSLLDLVHSAYGTVILAKVAGLSVLVAFGAYNRFRVLPRMHAGVSAQPGAASLRSSVTLELLVLCAVLILAGFLAYIPPPSGVDAHQHLTMQSL